VSVHVNHLQVTCQKILPFTEKNIYISRFYNNHFGTVCLSQENNITTSKWTMLANDHRSCLVVEMLMSELTNLTAVFFLFSVASPKYWNDG